ncbi:MAG: hypothetical protein ACRDQ2_00845 [Gaiellales bacterium]
MSVELALGALLAAAAVVFVAVPFLRAGEAPVPDEPAQDALAAAEERDRALAALKELEFDHRTGKITDEDYRALIQPLRRHAASTLANGATLPDGTAEQASEQRFSESSAPSSRSDR